MPDFFFITKTVINALDYLSKEGIQQPNISNCTIGVAAERIKCIMDEHCLLDDLSKGCEDEVLCILVSLLYNCGTFRL